MEAGTGHHADHLADQLIDLFAGQGADLEVRPTAEDERVDQSLEPWLRGVGRAAANNATGSGRSRRLIA